MKIFAPAIAALAMLTATSSPYAQGMAVIDRAQIAENKVNALKEIAEMVKQLDEAKRLYSSINGQTDMADIAELLNDPDVREILGTDYAKVATSLGPDINQMGDLRGTAQSLLDQTKVSQAEMAADDFYRRERERASQAAARDGSVGETILKNADQRLEGLEKLRLKLQTTENQKEVDALTARINIEAAMLQNDTNRIQGIAMLQEAQAKLLEQRDEEKDALWREQAAEERKKLYEQ